MGYKLKKVDVLVREQSTATYQDIVNFLNRMFNNIYNTDTDDGSTLLGYAAVFDSRSGEYYLYYSNQAKSVYRLSKNRYDIIPQGIVTRSNFMSVFTDNISNIVTALRSYFAFGAYKIKTVIKTIINGSKIELDDRPEGDIINNIALVKVDEDNNVFDEFVVTIDGNTIDLGATDDLTGKEAIVTYMTKEQ